MSWKTEVQRIAEIGERFHAGIEGCEPEILLDQGLYRHIRFKKGTPFGEWFELVTWPGRLTITGGRPAYTFSRLLDMFEFFRGDAPNPGYWSEKVIAYGQPTKVYSVEALKEMLQETAAEHEEDFPGLTIALQSHFFDGWEVDAELEDSARLALRDFEFPERFDRKKDAPYFQFTDTWEWNLHDWDFHYLWACHAIPWGIAQYDKLKAAV